MVISFISLLIYAETTGPRTKAIRTAYQNVFTSALTSTSGDDGITELLAKGVPGPESASKFLFS